MSLSVMLQQLASGMVVSVEIFVVTLLFSLPLGLLICFGRMSKNPAIRGIVSAYISVMRGTPLMLQLMVVYFGPYFIFGIRISMGYSLIAVHFCRCNKQSVPPELQYLFSALRSHMHLHIQQ